LNTLLTASDCRLPSTILVYAALISDLLAVRESLDEISKMLTLLKEGGISLTGMDELLFVKLSRQQLFAGAKKSGWLTLFCGWRSQRDGGQ